METDSFLIVFQACFSCTVTLMGSSTSSQTSGSENTPVIVRNRVLPLSRSDAWSNLNANFGAIYWQLPDNWVVSGVFFFPFSELDNAEWLVIVFVFLVILGNEGGFLLQLLLREMSFCATGHFATFFPLRLNFVRTRTHATTYLPNWLVLHFCCVWEALNDTCQKQNEK